MPCQTLGVVDLGRELLPSLLLVVPCDALDHTVERVGRRGLGLYFLLSVTGGRGGVETEHPPRKCRDR